MLLVVVTVVRVAVSVAVVVLVMVVVVVTIEVMLLVLAMFVVRAGVARVVVRVMSGGAEGVAGDSMGSDDEGSGWW